MARISALAVDADRRREADAIAREPWFFPEPHEPPPLAHAVQMPLSDPHWQSRVINGYVKTKLYAITDAGRDALRAHQQAQENG